MSVFLGIPSRYGVNAGVLEATHRHGHSDLYALRIRTGSLLALVFNSLWCDALNERPRVTEFVMLHDDVAPVEPYWLRVLEEERRKCGADILSAVSPIKDERGLSSTAFLNTRTGVMRRLTMREAYKDSDAQTFGPEIIGLGKEWVVLPNTGLMIVDFTRPWVEKFFFSVTDRIVYDSVSKEFKPQALGEDWGMGVWAAEHEISVKATTKVRLYHDGFFRYPAAPWGKWHQDQEEGVAFRPLRGADDSLAPYIPSQPTEVLDCGKRHG